MRQNSLPFLLYLSMEQILKMTTFPEGEVGDKWSKAAHALQGTGI